MVIASFPIPPLRSIRSGGRLTLPHRLGRQGVSAAAIALGWLGLASVAFAQRAADYNKLAELHGTLASYEDGHASPEDLDLTTALRWRAAQAGDPGAQRDMAGYFEQRDPDLAGRLNRCALERFPELK